MVEEHCTCDEGGAELVIDPFIDEICDEQVEIWLCPYCYAERCLDI